MPKLKTKKTLLKRIRITKNGKIVRKKVSIGHLKVKWSADRSSRKKQSAIQSNRGHIKKFKHLLAKAGRNIK